MDLIVLFCFSFVFFKPSWTMENATQVKLVIIPKQKNKKKLCAAALCLCGLFTLPALYDAICANEATNKMSVLA